MAGGEDGSRWGEGGGECCWVGRLDLGNIEEEILDEKVGVLLEVIPTQ
jgi:hypothetical protein